jgi:feruloyl esterase
MGGRVLVDSFYKLFVVPGLWHGNFNGTANRNVNPPIEGPNQAFKALVDWVENGVSPNMIFHSPPDGAPVATYAKDILEPSHGPEMSMPVCAYPTLPRYVGGDILKAESYRCR